MMRMSDERHSDSFVGTQRDDHRQILAALQSDDWLARVEAARQRRAMALQAQAASGAAPQAAARLQASPVPRDADNLAREARRRPLLQADPRTPPVSVDAHPGQSRRQWPRRAAIAGLVGLTAILAGGNISQQTLAPSWAPQQEPPQGEAQSTASQTPAPVVLEPAAVDDPRTRLGYPGMGPDALVRPGGYVVAASTNAPTDILADASTPTLAETLAQLALVAPPGTPVRLAPGSPGGIEAGPLVLVPTAFAVERSLVRYYHAEDRDMAQRSAAAIGAETEDFSTYAPRPPAGTIEIWLAD